MPSSEKQKGKGAVSLVTRPFSNSLAVGLIL